jgi:hypothetical protein
MRKMSAPSLADLVKMAARLGVGGVAVSKGGVRVG